MENPLDGPSRPPLSCGKPRYLVVLLHDAGSCGDAVADLALDWAPTLNKAEFLAPNGPWLEAGTRGGRSWTAPQGGAAQADGASTVEKLHAYLDAILAKRRLQPGQLALVGFAQGAALAIRAGLARSEPLAAVVGIAGGFEEDLDESHPARSLPPVLLVKAALPARPGAMSIGDCARRLQSVGVAVQTRAHPGDYFGLDDDGVVKVADYLYQALVKPAAAEA